MTVIAFVVSLITCSFVLSALEWGTNTPNQADKPDYHYVPYAGDVFGA